MGGLLGVATLVLTTLLLLACSGGQPTPAPELAVGIVSRDLSVGPNRLAFYLLDNEQEPISHPEASVSLYYPANTIEDGNAKEVAKAPFHQWPLGGLGVYSAHVELDGAGGWGLRVGITGPDGSVRYGEALIEVKEQSSTPSIGSPVPRSKNKTSWDVARLEELTTARPPDPELYLMTIDEAVASGKPLVVVFATPAFCETFTCGPQVEVITRLRERYKDRANFIHVEMFDNPHEIQGDPDSARAVAAVLEWGLTSEPWTFIVDRDGRVAAKFEAFSTAEEIEEELQKVLE